VNCSSVFFTYAVEGLAFTGLFGLRCAWGLAACTIGELFVSWVGLLAPTGWGGLAFYCPYGGIGLADAQQPI